MARKWKAASIWVSAKRIPNMTKLLMFPARSGLKRTDIEVRAVNYPGSKMKGVPTQPGIKRLEYRRKK